MGVLLQECVSVRVCVKGIKVRRSVNFGRTSAEKQIAAPRKYENEGTEQSREERREGREEEKERKSGGQPTNYIEMLIIQLDGRAVLCAHEKDKRKDIYMEILAKAVRTDL